MNNSNVNNPCNPNLQTFDIFNKTLDGIVIFNQDGVILDVNRSFCKYINTNKDEIIGYTLEHFVPKDKHYKLRRQKVLLEQNRNARGVLPILHQNGISYFSVVTSLDEDSGHYISVFRDETEKMNLKEQSAQYDYFFKELFIEAMDGIIFWDMKGQIINANQAACRIFECGYQDIIGANFDQFILKKNHQYRKILKELFETGAVNDQLFLKMPNGQEKLIEFTSRLHSKEGFHMTIFRNVSERYRMELELRESEQKFRTIFEGSLEGLVLWNDDGEIIDVNQAACQLFKTSRDEILGKDLINLLPDTNGNKQKLENIISTLEKTGQLHGTSKIYIDEETVKHFEFSSIFHLFSNVNFIVIKDVTEKIEMEKRLRKSDTLNVIGELAAGIAHEIRNPMTALKGFIQLLQGEMREDRSMYFQVILSELNRIDSIINEFLILAKPQVVKYSKVDIVQIMRDTVELLNAQAVMYNVQFRTYYQENLPIIFCEPNQLKKVFVNMIKNAIESMQAGGNITIFIESYKDDQIHISIKDEGFGIPPEKLKRLGEPFYTTKDRGTGLGLMVSYKIIEEHNGRIKVDSQENVGTTFHIYLSSK
ncbi:PAS domain S-box protein [Neobacillus sp. D3-1R]|uniref:PAS domain S-box protein n=1 Tax=Neobacillus sp. D3-1R TaxID=3445778 RepID=UPI003F9F60AD